MDKINSKFKIQNSKLEKLKEILKKMQRVLIAFSGGIDSSLLLKIAVDSLGRKNVIAVTGKSETYPRGELKEAKEFAKLFRVRHLIIQTNELKDKRFIKNPPNRCYYCKRELFSKLRKIAEQNNIKYILDGSNIDDKRDYRPGSLTKRELGINSPLEEAGFAKKDIRTLSKKLKLKNHSKPAFACLASRIPYGQAINKGDLKRIEDAEEFLKTLVFDQVRVRIHKNIARIETSPKQIKLAIQNRARISYKLRKLGFKYITLDLDGYRMGSMNEVLY